MTILSYVYVCSCYVTGLRDKVIIYKSTYKLLKRAKDQIFVNEDIYIDCIDEKIKI